MPTLIPTPAVIHAAGTPPKRIEEYAGRVTSGHAAVSVARMISPGGWSEPAQRPECAACGGVAIRPEHGGGTRAAPPRRDQELM